MIDFILKMLVCLFLAAAVGFMVAWLLRNLSVQQLRDEVSRLRRNLGERDSLLHDSETKLKAIKSTLSARDSTISAHETRLGALDTQITQLNQHRDLLSYEASTKDATIKARDVSLASLTALLAAHEVTSGSNPTVNTNLEQTITELQRTLADRETMLRVRDETLKARELKIEELERNVATLTGSWAVERDQLNVEIDASRRTLQSRSQLLSEAQAKLETSGLTLANLQSRVNGYEDNSNFLNQKIVELESQLKHGDESRRTLQERLDAGDSHATEPANFDWLIPPRQFEQPPALIDDIKHIYGVGPAIEKTLNQLGIYLFKQVALWSEADIDFFDGQLKDFHGRIRREQWVRSAVEEHYKKYNEWLGSGEAIITIPETNRD